MMMMSQIVYSDLVLFPFNLNLLHHVIHSVRQWCGKYSRLKKSEITASLTPRRNDRQYPDWRSGFVRGLFQISSNFHHHPQRGVPWSSCTSSCPDYRSVMKVRCRSGLIQAAGGTERNCSRRSSSDRSSSDRRSGWTCALSPQPETCTDDLCTCFKLRPNYNCSQAWGWSADLVAAPRCSSQWCGLTSANVISFTNVINFYVHALIQCLH